MIVRFGLRSAVFALLPALLIVVVSISTSPRHLNPLTVNLASMLGLHSSGSRRRPGGSPGFSRLGADSCPRRHCWVAGHRGRRLYWPEKGVRLHASGRDRRHRCLPIGGG